MDYINSANAPVYDYTAQQIYNWNTLLMTPECIFDQFCLCDLYFQPAQEYFGMPFKSRGQKGNKNIETFNFTTELQNLYMQVQGLLGTTQSFTKSCKKSQACSKKKVSKRRSQFTGVTRNSSNYQTLIVIKGKKQYVGSYEKEIYAAVVFDFYSMLLHGANAKTNFTYVAEDVLKMIENYTNHNSKFEPEEYLSNAHNLTASS